MRQFWKFQGCFTIEIDVCVFKKPKFLVNLSCLPQVVSIFSIVQFQIHLMVLFFFSLLVYTLYYIFFLILLLYICIEIIIVSFYYKK